MQVAHGVSLENCGEHWKHEQESEESHGVLLEVHDSVDWTHQQRQEVEREADHARKAKCAEICLSIWVVLELASVRVVRIRHACLYRREEAADGQCISNAQQRH